MTPTDGIPLVPRPAQPAESLVNACTATDCRYNKAFTCGAGAITITVSRGKAVCATFTLATTSVA